MVCKPEMDLQAIFSRDMGYVFSAFFVRKIYIGTSAFWLNYVKIIRQPYVSEEFSMKSTEALTLLSQCNLGALVLNPDGRVL